jgi:ankyrin repeat protein
VAVFLFAAMTGLGAANSPVADAAMKSDLAAVRALISKKADVNAPQVDGSTALHWAVHRDHLEIADALIKGGADVKQANRTGVTPLSMASLVANPKMIKLLLDAGADAKSLGPNGETMLMFAARNGNPEAIAVLVAGGADVNAKEALRGTTALMWAAEQRHPEAVRALLKAGADHSIRSAVAGQPRNYLAPRVNTRNVEEAQRRRERAAAAGRTYQEQLEFENANGGGRGGGRGGNSPGGPILPGQTGGAAPAAAAPAGAAPADAAGAGAGAAQGQAGQGGGRGGRGGRGGGRGQGQGGAAAQPEPTGDGVDDDEVVIAGLTGSEGGGLTALIFASREGDLESVTALLDAGADVNLATFGGWTPLLTAVNNRNYRIASLLLERGANPNTANNRFGWTPLYLATDNRNIEGGDYPVPKPDMDHMEIIRLLLDKGANVDGTINDNTLTRTIFTMQWFYEAGATPFLRAAQSSDTELMKLLLSKGADPKKRTDHGDTALTLAAGIGWVDGVTYERSPKANIEAVRFLLDLGLDPNIANSEGRTPLMGAAAKGRNEVVQMLVDAGAKLDTRDRGSRDTHIVGASIAGHTWDALDYSEGLVRVGVQSAVARPETSALLRKLMKERGLPVPAENRTIQSICITEICKGIPLEGAKPK